MQTQTILIQNTKRNRKKKKKNKTIDTGRKEQWIQDAQFSFLPLKYLPHHHHVRGLRPLCLMDVGFLVLLVVSYSASI